MTTRERCDVCDFPLATDAGTETAVLSGWLLPDVVRSSGLCWAKHGGPHGPAIDWRARALEAAREHADAMKSTLARVEKLEGDLSAALASEQDATRERHALKHRVEALEGALRRLLVVVDGEETGGVAECADAVNDARAALGPTPPPPAPDEFSRWPVVREFARAMMRKLDQHAPKRGGREGWQNDDPRALWCRVTEEAGELWNALGLSGTKQQVLDEAADVANMAMMVADAEGAISETTPTPDPSEETCPTCADAECAIHPTTQWSKPSLNTPQPSPTAGEGAEVWPSLLAKYGHALPHELIALCRERDARGREKYGTPLRAKNGRDPLIDALQEMLDLAAYLHQAELERSSSEDCRIEAMLAHLLPNLRRLWLMAESRS
ncbi:MAG: hypothetical protein ACOZQL_10825 [Myxococcota bacterium]